MRIPLNLYHSNALPYFLLHCPHNACSLAALLTKGYGSRQPYSYTTPRDVTSESPPSSVFEPELPHRAPATFEEELTNEDAQVLAQPRS